MRHFGIGLLLAVTGWFVTSDSLAQRAAIRIEAMDIHKLHEQGLPNPNGWDNVSSGMSAVGKGTLVWLSAWDISGDTTWKPASSSLWSLVTKPSGSATVLDSTTTQRITFKPDMVGNYAVRLTVGSSDTTVTIVAANYIGTNRHNLPGTPLNCATCHSTGAAFQAWATSGHAKKFENGMNGGNGSYWGANCFKCHTTGYNVSASNGGFDDVATTLGFVDSLWRPWRPGLYDSLLTTDKKMLSMVAGIGCENCHGPRNPAHAGLGTQPKTMRSDVCGQCHNEPWRHNRYVQWESSGHAGPPWSNSFRSSGSTLVTQYTLNTCIRCHDGEGFMSFTKGIPFDNRTSTGYSKVKRTEITCQTCHEPHSATLRVAPAGSDTLANGYNYSATALGEGKTCVNCHKFRRNAETYTTSNMSSNWGPHYGGATDVFLGKNAYTFGQTIPSSIGHQMIDKTCVGCHMSATPDTGTAARDKIGMHTWNMHYTTNTGQKIDNVTGCTSCHGSISSFDDIIAAFDYDGDGTVEPFLDEVEGLKDLVALALPPRGSTDIDRTLLASDPDSVNLKRAFYNYLYVKYGGAHGVHNPKFVVGLLQRSLFVITGVELPGSETVPQEFALRQNYPNPFNPSTTISFDLPTRNHVVLEVYDVLGKLVKTLINEEMMPGNMDIQWDGTDNAGQHVTSGVYLYRIEAGSFTMARKMVLVK